MPTLPAHEPAPNLRKTIGNVKHVLTSVWFRKGMEQSPFGYHNMSAMELPVADCKRPRAPHSRTAPEAEDENNHKKRTCRSRRAFIELPATLHADTCNGRTLAADCERLVLQGRQGEIQIVLLDVTSAGIYKLLTINIAEQLETTVQEVS